jgi:iodotyrosine deiodinase
MALAFLFSYNSPMNPIGKKSLNLLNLMKKRRSTRAFSKKRISLKTIKNCLAIANSAPSGANMQPWTFVLIKTPASKKALRLIAEKTERNFYSKYAPKEWKEKLKPLNVNAKKEFLEQAPYLICVFAQMRGIDAKGATVKHYYPTESACLAAGFLVMSLRLCDRINSPFGSSDLN